MALTINTNIASLKTQFALDRTGSNLQTSMQRLSTGLRINSAKDDAAGLSIATKMDSQIRGMTVAIRNANDAFSVSQTAEAGMDTITNALQRARELAVQAKNTGATSGEDRAKLQDEFKQLGDEVKRIIGNTEYNGIRVLQSGLTSANFQVGANAGDTDVIKLNLNNVSTLDGIKELIAGQLDIGSAKTASEIGDVIEALDNAISSIASSRGTIGAFQNRLTSSIANLQAGIEAQTAAKGRIMDADFSAEMSKFTSNQILQQAGTAMLAQANQSQQIVLSLLR